MGLVGQQGHYPQVKSLILSHILIFLIANLGTLCMLNLYPWPKGPPQLMNSISWHRVRINIRGISSDFYIIPRNFFLALQDPLHITLRK